MSTQHHTQGRAACQPPMHPSYPHNVGDTDVANHTIDYRLAARYSATLLTKGYTALPNLVYIYYQRLGVTEAELVFITQLCTYWWSTQDPHPGAAVIASRMGKTERCIRGYIRSLERKGLLHISTQFSPRGRQETNSYSLRPFFQAIEGLAYLEGLTAAVGDHDSAAPAPPAPVGAMSSPVEACISTQRAGRAEPLCAEKPERGEETGARGVNNPSAQVNPVEKDRFDLASMPPTPTNASPTDETPATQGRLTPAARETSLPPIPVATAASFSRPAGRGLCDPPVPLPVKRAAQLTPNDQALAATMATLSTELGDDAPASSLGRARNLWRDAGGSLDRFLRLVDEAAARTRARQATIVKRRRDGQATNGMPYLFAVLQDLLHPAPRHSDTPAPERGHRERRGRQRRRPREEPARTPWVGWTDTPVRRPITETNPVWRAVLDELSLVLTIENFNTWLAATRVVGQDGEVLRIAVPTAFNKLWLEEKLQGRVRSTLERVGYGSWQVEYGVAAAPGAVRTDGDDVMIS